MPGAVLEACTDTMSSRFSTHRAVATFANLEPQHRNCCMHHNYSLYSRFVFLNIVVDVRRNMQTSSRRERRPCLFVLLQEATSVLTSLVDFLWVDFLLSAFCFCSYGKSVRRFDSVSEVCRVDETGQKLPRALGRPSERMFAEAVHKALLESRVASLRVTADQ